MNAIEQVRRDVSVLWTEKSYAYDPDERVTRRVMKATFIARIGWEIGDKPMSFVEALQRGRRHLYTGE